MSGLIHLIQSLIISRISYTRDSKHKINIEQKCSPSHEMSISLSTQLFTTSQQFNKDMRVKCMQFFPTSVVTTKTGQKNKGRDNNSLNETE